MTLLKRRKFVGNGIISRLTDKGFGFIKRENEERDLFFHSNELAGVSFGELREGDYVGFDIANTPKGLIAINIGQNVRPQEEEQEEEQEEDPEEDPEEEQEEEIADRDDSNPDLVMSAAVKVFSSTIAKAIAQNPEVLEKIEWRDLERLIAEVFSGLGFDAELTPGSKDGGKDVIVSFRASNGERKSYFVEIKHWRAGKLVGRETVSAFVHVIARESKTGGLLLATHGFTRNAIETFTEIERVKIGLGTNQKVIGLCRHYVRANEGIWHPPARLDKVIFEDTI